MYKDDLGFLNQKTNVDIFHLATIIIIAIFVIGLVVSFLIPNIFLKELILLTVCIGTVLVIYFTDKYTKEHDEKVSRI